MYLYLKIITNNLATYLFFNMFMGLFIGSLKIYCIGDREEHRYKELLSLEREKLIKEKPGALQVESFEC